MTTVASIQMVSTDDVSENLQVASQLIAEAVAQGAEFLLLPENFMRMGDDKHGNVGIMEPFGDGPLQNFLAQQSQQHKIWLMGGTIPLQGNVANKSHASCLLYDPNGECTFRYDKIHLFDVIVDHKSGESYQESNTIVAGDKVVVATTPFAKIGMSVCYDLRFPELYRAMHRDKVQIITVCSAFTLTTGKAHWKSLLRSRAIENLCYIIASNQGGKHADGRQTWGHSMIIDPWGNILDSIESGAGFALADIDLEQQQVLRRDFPCLQHQVLN